MLLTPQTLTGGFQSLFSYFFNWPLSLGRDISLSAPTRQDISVSTRTKEYNNLISSLTEQLEQERRKVDSLSKLHQRFNLEGIRFIVPDILTGSSGDKDELFINRGEKDGIKIGQFVLGQNGVIGTIVHAGGRTATVRLITHPQSKLKVRIKEMPAILQGKSNNQATIKMISVKHEIGIGEKVFAMPTLYLPQSTITAIVSKLERDDESQLLWDITLEPICDIENLTSVAVIAVGEDNL